MVPAITEAMITFSDFALTSGDISAPTAPSAAKAATGLVNNSEINSVGFCKSSTCAACVSESTTPFANVTVAPSTIGGSNETDGN